jgi:co-chaperonin GroES (HSP10)
VIAVGKGIDDIKVGDKIIYGMFAGEKIKINEDDKEVEYVLLFDDDVLAFLK